MVSFLNSGLKIQWNLREVLYNWTRKDVHQVSLFPCFLKSILTLAQQTHLSFISSLGLKFFSLKVLSFLLSTKIWSRVCLLGSVIKKRFEVELVLCVNFGEIHLEEETDMKGTWQHELFISRDSFFGKDFFIRFII